MAEVARFPDRFYLPAYTYTEAGRYAQTNPQNVRRWFKGQSHSGHAMLPVFAQPPTHGLSYIQLIEIVFVAAMRREGLPLDEMRRAYVYVREQLGLDYPFAEERFVTDGINLFIEALDNADALIAVSKHGQVIAREALVGVTKQIDYADELAARWYVRGREHPIVVNPRVAFGRPTIHGKGIPTSAIGSRFRAGDAEDLLASDFEITPYEVAEAVWFETQLKNAA